MLDLVFKTAPISDHVAKFRGDRPRDRGDLAPNKKRKERKKETAAKHCVIATGGPNNWPQSTSNNQLFGSSLYSGTVGVTRMGRKSEDC